jgi:hypothetical protein
LSIAVQLNWLRLAMSEAKTHASEPSNREGGKEEGREGRGSTLCWDGSRGIP